MTKEQYPQHHLLPHAVTGPQELLDRALTQFPHLLFRLELK